MKSTIELATRSCNKHRDKLPLLIIVNETQWTCLFCSWAKIERLQRYNDKLQKSIAEERRLRKAAQVVIGKLMVINPLSEHYLTLAMDQLRKFVDQGIKEQRGRS